MGKGKDFWLDDPEWELLRRKAEKRPIPKKLKQQAAAQKQPVRSRQEEPPRAQASRQVTEKEVVVNLKLRMPKVKLPDFKLLYKQLLRRLQAIETRKKRALLAGSALVGVLLIFGAFRAFSPGGKTAGVTDEPKSAQEQAQTDFNPLVPLEGVTDANGKQSKPEFKYDKEKKVLAYVATYNNAQLTISQQKVPEDFKKDPAKLMSVASSINANTPMDTQKGAAYIATDEKTRAQIAVFATDEVLVFVRTDKELDDESWKFYINQLNPSK